MVIYGFQFLDFMPNAMACMAIFAHLCENFAGVAPNVDLFRHFFVPLVENKAHRSGNVSWIPWVARESWDYLPGQQRNRWEESRADWCWIQDEEALEFCQARRECIVHGNDCREFILADDRLRAALNRITHLKALGVNHRASGS